MSTQNSKDATNQNPESSTIDNLNPNGFFNESTKGSCSVKVAVRVRPLLPKEIAAGDSSCIKSIPEKNSVVVGVDKTFTFDRVFGVNSSQEEVFDVCAKNLMLSAFAGYNSTVLAYGQTCSGKTFTMGTDSVLSSTDDQHGIIPRVIKMMFDEVEKRKTTREFIIKVSFIEIYNEEIHDLLDPQSQNKIAIRELTRGIPSLCGQQEERVMNFEELFRVLERGAVHRRTRSTLMNECSSRSHAILEINIEQHLISDLGQSQSTEVNSEQEFVTAKFHFVDLAGSERIKRTGAEGETLQEGISINKALFVLGKVINALTDETGRSCYKPYRESNLTRILQDSLGGNARTTMIACVSPADSNQEETLSTLLYACKARSIKNKPVVNRDPNSTLIHQLEQQVFDLQKELNRFKKNGPLPSLKEIDIAAESELKAEIASLKRENESLKSRISQFEDEARKKEIEFLETQKERDIFQLQNEKLKKAILENPDSKIEIEKVIDTTSNIEEVGVLEKYQKQTAELQEKISKQTTEIQELQSKYEEECKNANIQSEQMLSLNQELQRLKRTITKSRKVACKSSKENIKQPNPLEKDVSGPWLSEDLNEQLKEVQDVFINELAQSLDTLITDTTKEQQTVEEAIDEMEESEESKPESKAEEEIKETLNKVDGDIHEREKMLGQIKEKHKEMQKNLISIMENQYHKKVEELEREMEKVKKDQEKAIRLAPNDNKGSVDLQYKKKLNDYEIKIKEYRKNMFNQQKLVKQASEQEGKIQLMTDELMKMKQQKLDLVRKMRKEKESYEKTKKEHMREALKLKQETVKQKIMITKLVKEKERTAKLKENCKNEMSSSAFSKDRNYRALIEDFSTQLATIKFESGNIQKEEQKQKDINSKLDLEYSSLYKLKLESEKIELFKKEFDPIKDYDKIKQSNETLEQIQKRITNHQINIDNLEATLRYHEERVIKIEQSKSGIRTQLTTLMNRSRIKSSREINELITVLFETLAEEKTKRNEDSIKSKADQNTITVLTENIHNLIKANKILQEEFESETAKLKEVFAAKEAILNNERELLLKSSVDANNAKKQKQEQSKEDNESTKFMKKELEDYKKRNTEIMKETSTLRNKIIELTGENEKLSKSTVNLNRKVDNLSMKLKKTDTNAKPAAKITNLNEQRLNKKKRMLTKDKLSETSNNIAYKGTDTLSSKRYSQARLKVPEEIKDETEKIITEIPKKSSAINKTTQIRGPASLKATTAKLVMCRPTASSSFYTTLEDQLDANNKKAIVSTTRSKTPMEPQEENPLKSAHRNSIAFTTKLQPAHSCASLFSARKTGRWKCVYSEQMHDFGISSIVSYEDYLVSSSNTIKLWDINKQATVMKIPVANSKILYMVPTRKLLITASEQSGSVSLCNINNLETVRTFETRLDSVKSVYVSEDFICIGGSGSVGTVQVWDINTMSMLHSREVNNDIQALMLRQNVLYYGGLNCSVNRFRTDTLKCMESLNPIHCGPVTALKNLDELLISGCAEYLLRTWCYESGKERCSEQKREPQLTALQTDGTEEELYTGGSNGHIKIWEIVNGRLLDTVDLEGHDQSVNGIAYLGVSRGFASAGDDRTVKIWNYIN